MFSLIGAIIIGIVAGWLAEKIMKRDHSLWVNLIVGVVGSILGRFVAGLIGLQFAGLIGSLLISTVGAVLLLHIMGLVRQKA